MPGLVESLSGSTAPAERPTGRSPAGRRRSPPPFRVDPMALLFIAPAVVIVFLVSIYPVFDAAVLSVFQTSYATKVAFIGLGNYIALFTDPGFWNSAGNALVFTTGSLVLVVPLSLGLALLLDQNVPFRGLTRTVVILPWVMSQTVVALLWAWLLNGDFGPLTYAAEAMLGHRPAFLSEPGTAMASLVVVNVWASYPQATLLLLAAVQTIPKELFEAADVDGAPGWAKLRYVTFPMIRPTLLVVMIQLTLLYFNMVTLIYTLTGGGPLDGTETLGVRVMKVSFENWNLGYGAALGLVVTLVNLVISLVYVKTLKPVGK